MNTMKSQQLKHLLTIENMPEALIVEILQRAEKYIRSGDHHCSRLTVLKHKTLINLFFEPSTRTRISFELAAKRLGADVINFNASESSILKGETALDTFCTLQAMYSDFFVVRHQTNHIPELFAQHAKDEVSIINAGDGTHEHPSQALLDVFTIRQCKKDFKQLSIAIVGDIAHSRVARSLVQALKILHVPDIRLVASNALLPTDWKKWGVIIYDDLSSGLSHADVIVVLRMQRERMAEASIPNVDMYKKKFSLDKHKLALAKPDAIVMHPGPVNRGIEIEPDVVDSSQSVILQQVENGIAIRMAILTVLSDEKLFS